MAKEDYLESRLTMDKIDSHLRVYTVLIIGLTLLLFILTVYGQIVWSLILLSITLKVVSDRSQMITDAFLDDTSELLIKNTHQVLKAFDEIQDLHDKITLLEIQIIKLQKHENSNSRTGTKLDPPI